MVGRYALIGIMAGIFVAGIGMGYAVLIVTYNPYPTMYQNPQVFNQMMGRNPQFASQYMGYLVQNPQYMNRWFSQNPQYQGQWMGYMMQDPQLRQQMYNYMFQNRNFMYGLMGNQTFQSQYMGPWMTQNPQFQRQWVGQSGMFGSQFNGTEGNSPSAYPGYAMGPGMMSGGSGMMSGGQGSTYGGSTQSFKTISISDAKSAAHLPTYAQVSKGNNTIVFDSKSVSLVPLSFMGDDAVNFTGSSAPSYATDDVFVIGDMIDPTLVFKAGTSLTVTSINLDDDMSHNFVIMTSSPPYQYMAMQNTMYGGVVASMPVLPNDDQQKGYAYEYSYSVDLSQPGTYWYVCTYPGHAEEGMYGKIIVK